MKSLISKILKEEFNKSIINRIGSNDKIHVANEEHNSENQHTINKRGYGRKFDYAN